MFILSAAFPRRRAPLVGVFFLLALWLHCFFALPGEAGNEKTDANPTASPASPKKTAMLGWKTVLPGLELAITELPESKAAGSGALFVALRIDPARHAFALCMASESGQSRSFAGWSRAAGLRAGVNASMYLPDGVTSTGYMRNGESVNNTNLGGRLGAFFVAGPKKRSAPPARILERDVPGWRSLLDDYRIVAQNYRFMDSAGKVLWRGGGPLHSIAVVASDTEGRILFILSQEPLTAERFAWHLRSFPLSLTSVMYVEGGAQAGIFLRLDNPPDAPEKSGAVHVWKGRQSILNTPGNPNAILPNIIGVAISP